MYPFIEPDNFPSFAHTLTHELAKKRPFDITLAKMGCFGSARSGVCWLDPCTTGQQTADSYQILSELHAGIVAVLNGKSVATHHVHGDDMNRKHDDMKHGDEDNDEDDHDEKEKEEEKKR
jgi:hypothetical protein